jgi:hypothetical protein
MDQSRSARQSVEASVQRDEEFVRKPARMRLGLLELTVFRRTPERLLHLVDRLRDDHPDQHGENS